MYTEESKVYTASQQIIFVHVVLQRGSMPNLQSCCYSADSNYTLMHFSAYVEHSANCTLGLVLEVQISTQQDCERTASQAICSPSRTYQAEQTAGCRDVRSQVTTWAMVRGWY